MGGRTNGERSARRPRKQKSKPASLEAFEGALLRRWGGRRGGTHEWGTQRSSTQKRCHLSHSTPSRFFISASICKPDLQSEKACLRDSVSQAASTGGAL